MRTVLTLQSKQEPYTFKSLGQPDKFEESTLFPIGSIVELTYGLFPFHSCFTSVSKSVGIGPHIIGGKSVRIIEYTHQCQERWFSSWTGPFEITVNEFDESYDSD